MHDARCAMHLDLEWAISMHIHRTLQLHIRTYIHAYTCICTALMKNRVDFILYYTLYLHSIPTCDTYP